MTSEMLAKFFESVQTAAIYEQDMKLTNIQKVIWVILSRPVGDVSNNLVMLFLWHPPKTAVW